MKVEPWMIVRTDCDYAVRRAPREADTLRAALALAREAMARWLAAAEEDDRAQTQRAFVVRMAWYAIQELEQLLAREVN